MSWKSSCGKKAGSNGRGRSLRLRLPPNGPKKSSTRKDSAGSKETAICRLQDQVILRALYLLRDKIARKLDVPPFKVLNNSVLIDLVRRPPASAGEMFNRPGISYRVARRFAADILRTINEARHQDPTPLETPARNNWKPPSRAVKLRLEALKRWRQEKARELNLHVGVVFPANVLENLAVAPPADLGGLGSLAGMRRWRVQEFGKELIDLLHKEAGQAQPEPPGN